MRRLHTDMPLGSERSSGSAVRLPVSTTRLMFVAAMSPSFPLRRPVGSGCVSVSEGASESRPALGRQLWSEPAPCGDSRVARPQAGWPKRGFAPQARVSRLRSGPSFSLASARGGAEDLVPVRRADPKALRLVLEVMAHVALPQHPPHAPPWPEVVHVVVEHVVRQIPREEARAQAWRVTGPEDEVDRAEHQR